MWAPCATTNHSETRKKIKPSKRQEIQIQPKSLSQSPRFIELTELVIHTKFNNQLMVI